MISSVLEFPNHYQNPESVKKQIRRLLSQVISALTSYILRSEDQSDGSQDPLTKAEEGADAIAAYLSKRVERVEQILEHPPGANEIKRDSFPEGYNPGI